MKQTCVLVFVLLAACGPGGRNGGNGGDDDDSQTCPRCSDDKQVVIDCDGNAKACAPDQLCSNGECMNGCAAAENNHASIGCEYYAVDMDAAPDALAPPVVAPPMPSSPSRTARQGSQRYGEAVVRQVLHARFVREEPYEPPTRFS